MMSRLYNFLTLGLALLLAFALAGCSGGNSSNESAGGGAGGGAGAQFDAVTVTDNGTVAKMEVFFRLSEEGAPLSAVDGNNIRFSVVKLIPAASSSAWQSYINVIETKEAGDPGNAPDGTPTPDGTTATQATAERASTAGGVFKDNGDGTYSYKFSFNFRAVTDPVTGAPIAYEPSLTHRIAMQVSDNATNATYDFIPNNMNATPDTRSIVANVSCSECHDKFGFHGGDRVAVDYCVTCHNPGSSDANSLNTVDFTVMVHKIHSGENGPEVEAGGEYAIWGFNNTKHDYSDVLYPQDTVNCIKCHDGTDPETPDGDNWKNAPSEAACTSCHEDPNSPDYPDFPNLTADEIETAHVTPNPTPNNPDLPPGVPVIEYVLNSATVDGNNQAVITFQVLRDGVPLDLLNLPADLTAANNRPTFVLAYALPQDGITDPAEYNNLGEDSAQPLTVNLNNLGVVDNEDGTMVDNGDGTFTATTGGTTFPAGAFPAGATLRAVGLQGYFQVDVGADRYPLHTPSAVIAVDGDDERREVVDSNSCASCHEWFEGHGGNRVLNMNICVFCHVPNLSSSGRRIDPADASDAVKDAYGADPLLYPEATNNFKDMIHGIHGAEIRTTDYEFVRDRNDGIPYNWSEVVFPASAGDCLRCHKSETFEVPLDDDTLLTTNRITGVVDGDDADFNAVLAARASVPNATDFVITATAAACYACHDSADAQAHMEQNGAAINDNRSDLTAAGSVETCSVCHSSGKTADLAVAHAATDEATVIGRITAPESDDDDDDGDGGSSQADLCGPGPPSARPPGHTNRLDCCSCHGFN